MELCSISNQNEQVTRREGKCGELEPRAFLTAMSLSFFFSFDDFSFHGEIPVQKQREKKKLKDPHVKSLGNQISLSENNALKKAAKRLPALC